MIVFVVEGVLLLWWSGVDDCLLMEGVFFGLVFEGLWVEVFLINGGVVMGMGILCGVMLIVGGGYYGKSILFLVVVCGVYDYVFGDGCDCVVIVFSVVIICVEDGWCVEKVGIYFFIDNLLGGMDIWIFLMERVFGLIS